MEQQPTLTWKMVFHVTYVPIINPSLLKYLFNKASISSLIFTYVVWFMDSLPPVWSRGNRRPISDNLFFPGTSATESINWQTHTNLPRIIFYIDSFHHGAHVHAVLLSPSWLNQAFSAVEPSGPRFRIYSSRYFNFRPIQRSRFSSVLYWNLHDLSERYIYCHWFDRPIYFNWFDKYLKRNRQRGSRCCFETYCWWKCKMKTLQLRTFLF